MDANTHSSSRPQHIMKEKMLWHWYVHIPTALCVWLCTACVAETDWGWAMNHLCINPDVRQYIHQSCQRGKKSRTKERRTLLLPSVCQMFVIDADEQSTQCTLGGKIHKNCKYLEFDQLLAYSTFFSICSLIQKCASCILLQIHNIVCFLILTHF